MSMLRNAGITIDYGVSKDCKNIDETYGVICVRCGKCGRTFENRYTADDNGIKINSNSIRG